jgi:hypothetical protein
MKTTNASKKTISEQIKVRACSISQIDHPEYGTFGVFEDKGFYFVVLGKSGFIAVDKSEINKFWKIEAN